MLRLCPDARLNDLAFPDRQDHGGIRSFRLNAALSGRADTASLASAYRQDHGAVRSFRLDHNLSSIGRVDSGEQRGDDASNRLHIWTFLGFRGASRRHRTTSNGCNELRSDFVLRHISLSYDLDQVFAVGLTTTVTPHDLFGLRMCWNRIIVLEETLQPRPAAPAHRSS